MSCGGSGESWNPLVGAPSGNACPGCGDCREPDYGFCHETQPRARRAYVCDLCAATLPKGERYLRRDGFTRFANPEDGTEMCQGWSGRYCLDEDACATRCAEAAEMGDREERDLDAVVYDDGVPW